METYGGMGILGMEIQRKKLVYDLRPTANVRLTFFAVLPLPEEESEWKSICVPFYRKPFYIRKRRNSFSTKLVKTKSFSFFLVLT